VTELCAFEVTRKLARQNTAGLVAMVLPFFLESINYAPEARCYSFLLASLAVSIMCYQEIISDSAGFMWHFGLAASLAAAVLTHYFGILLVAPVWAGELARTLRRRTVDIRVLSTLTVGTLFVLADLPFEKALAPFRTHYFNTGETSWWMITFTYLWLKFHVVVYVIQFYYVRTARILGGLIILLVLASIASAIRRSFRDKSGAQFPVVVALATAASLPVLNVAAAQFTKAYVPRYSLPSVFGISVLLALFIRAYRSEKAQALIAAVLFGWGTLYAFGQIRMCRAIQVRVRQSSLTPGQQRVLLSLKDQHIYVQHNANFLVLQYYKQQPFHGLLSGPCELKWNGWNAGTLLAQNMVSTAHLKFSPFSAIYADGEPHMLLHYGDGRDEWIDQELLADHAEIINLGGAFGGQLALVRFTHGQTCD
jgi:hypothetical protein